MRSNLRIISCHLEHFLKDRKAALQPSATIEPVHRMRVASRWLRAALNVFMDVLPENKAKVWRRELKKIGRVLGRARELDVQIRFLEATQKKLKGERALADTETIKQVLKRRRRQAQKRINGELKVFELKKRLPGLKDWLKEGIGNRRRRRLMQAFEDQKGAVVLKRLDQLLEFSEYAFRPQSGKEQHLLRICAKKLRYTLELLRPWYGKKMDEYIRACREIQDVLGDLHEQDVLIGVLSALLKKEDKEFNKTVAYLIKECAGLRRNDYEKFVRLWKYLHKQHFWETLREAI
jgi:CHAD domain-containing protein